MPDPVLLHHYLDKAAAEHPEKTALIAGEERWTYTGLHRASTALAATLSRLSIHHQDRVAVFLDNCPETVITLFGALKAGGIFIILDGGTKAGRLRYILRDSGARILITHVNKRREVEEALKDRDVQCTVIEVGRQEDASAALTPDTIPWDMALKEVPQDGGSRVDHGMPSGSDQDLAAIIYTSGSLGEPKGVMCSHHNMISVSRSIIEYLENTADDVLLNVLPLSFGYGLYQVITSVMTGATVVLERSIAYPVKVLEVAQRENVTGFAMVPTIVALLLRLKNLESFGLGSLRYITNAAAALPVEHIRKLRTLLPRVKIYSMYGLTECARATYLEPHELDRRPHSVGKAIPHTEVFVMNEEGREAAVGDVGELVIRGSHVMRGYWNAPELTARTFRPGKHPGETLLHSGDLFKSDEEGYLFYIGRKDDMIKSKGERISPREIENALCAIPGVAEAAVFGVPDEIFGEAIMACVLTEPTARLSEQQIQKQCAATLQPLMVPKFIRIMDTLPRTPNNKIDKKELKRQHSEKAKEARAAN